MRTHIAKSLQTRCRAIQNAVTKYNTAAVAVGRPTLDWSKVSHYSFLEDFTLLRDTREEVLQKPWVAPQARLALQQHRRIKRAKEEIIRLNVEVRRLHTAIVDEDADMRKTVTQLIQEKSPLLPVVEEHCLRRRCINNRLLTRIHQIYALEGFTGTRGPGICIGREPTTDPTTAADAGDGRSVAGRVPVEATGEEGTSEEATGAEATSAEGSLSVAARPVEHLPSGPHGRVAHQQGELDRHDGQDSDDSDCDNEDDEDMHITTRVINFVGSAVD